MGVHQFGVKEKEAMNMVVRTGEDQVRSKYLTCDAWENEQVEQC